jgi:hypothetical protein
MTLMKRLTTTLPLLILLLVLGGCVQTRTIAPPGLGHPAAAESEPFAFSPPANPFATAIVSDANVAPGEAMTDMPETTHDGAEPPSALTVYSCPMHAAIRSDRPGDCPKCGMALVPTKTSAPGRHDHGSMP